MLDERERAAEALKPLLERLGLRLIGIPESGKKSLVYTVEGGGQRGILRIYRDPARLARSLWAKSRAQRFSLCVRTLKLGIATGVPGWFVLEELAHPTDGVCRGELEDFMERLALFHRGTRLPALDAVVARKWVRKTAGSARYVEKAGGDTSGVLELASGVRRLTASLCHTDIGLSNAGFLEGRLTLFDWDRACYYPCILEVWQAIFHLGAKDVKGALEKYLAVHPAGFEELRICGVMLCVSRMKKALKRKDEEAFSLYRGRLATFLSNPCAFIPERAS